MIILIINVLLKPSTSSSLVASFLSSWRYIFIWPNHYYLSYLTQSLSFIASARNNSRCSSSSFFFLSYHFLSRRTWVILLRNLFYAKKFWRDKNTATKFLRHKVMATNFERTTKSLRDEIMATKFPIVFQKCPPPRRLATRDWDNFLPNSINLHKLTQRPAAVPSGFSYLFNYDMEKQVIYVFTFLLLKTILAVLWFAVRIIFSVVPFLLEIDERCKNLGWALLRQETR